MTLSRPLTSPPWLFDGQDVPCVPTELPAVRGIKRSGNGHPSAAGLVESVTHKIAWTVNHGTEIKMAQGLTTDIEGGPA